MDLTPEEISFLGTHGLSPSDVLDGRRMSRDQSRYVAKDLGLTVVLGSACQKAGHRLRTRAGHCAQCDPANLSFEKRHRQPKEVYLAFSHHTSSIKVGSSRNVEVRINQINSEAVGGATDWRLIFRVSVEEGQRLETEVHTQLAEHMIATSYIKDGRQQVSRECFKCSASQALEAVVHAAQRRGHVVVGDPWKSPAWPA